MKMICYIHVLLVSSFPSQLPQSFEKKLYSGARIVSCQSIDGKIITALSILQYADTSDHREV